MQWVVFLVLNFSYGKSHAKGMEVTQEVTWVLLLYCQCANNRATSQVILVLPFLTYIKMTPLDTED